MKHILSRSVAYLALVAALPALTLAGPAQAQQSPFAGDMANADLMPDGSRLQAEYAEIGGAVRTAGSRATMSAAAAGFAAAAEIQSRLPAGFTLGQGSTSRISADLPSPVSASPSARFAAPRAAATPPAVDRFVTLYPVAFGGVPLAKGSDYLAVVTEDGRLLHTRERNLPGDVDATDPTTTADAAVAAAQDTLAARFAAADIEASAPELEIWVPADLHGRLAWTFTLHNDSLTAPEAIKVWVAAAGSGAPEILHAENRIMHTHHGQVTGTYWDASPFGTTVNQGLRDLEVQRTNAGGGMTVTGEGGRYAFTSGSGDATIDVLLEGPRSIVENAAGAVLADSDSGSPDDPLDLNFAATDEQTFAQVSAFHWTGVAQRMVADILDSPADVVDLRELRTIVNIADSCNAFYHPFFVTTNFFQSGNGCPNTAYADVVLHEDGHAFDHAKGDILDGGYSEGFGDAVAILGTRQSCLGRDFFGAGTCLRPADQVILWPPAAGEGVHDIGRRYAGFTWELIQQLSKTYADSGAYEIAQGLVLASAQANPADIPDAVHLAFVMDDDDGDLTNGSPHFKELAEAADSRNLPRPADPVIDHGVVTAAADFPWSDFLQVSANSNLVETTFTLTQPTTVHITANTSAHATTTPTTIRTGFFNAAAVNVMWTNSLRHVSLDAVDDWANFGSSFTIDLPAGAHTIYWKLWTSDQIEFSSGTILVEALGAAGPLFSLNGEAITQADTPFAAATPAAGRARVADRPMRLTQQ